MMTLLGACGGRQAAPVLPLTDSTTAALRSDSLLTIARRDSAAVAARRDSAAARARADSVAREGAERARADSVRAQILRDSAAVTPAADAGLDAARTATLAAPVRFDYDRADIREADTGLLEQKLAILRAFPRLALDIEGHTDERGADEYNLALGQRRAATVKRWFVENGVDAARLRVVSYGEERPAAAGAGEEAFAQNRRAEFRVTAGAR